MISLSDRIDNAADSKQKKINTFVNKNFHPEISFFPALSFMNGFSYMVGLLLSARTVS